MAIADQTACNVSVKSEFRPIYAAVNFDWLKFTRHDIRSKLQLHFTTVNSY